MWDRAGALRRAALRDVAISRAVSSQRGLATEPVRAALRPVATMPALAVRILELVAAHGEVTVGGVIAVTGAPRGTVKKWLGELTAAGQLRLVGEGRGARDVVGDKQFPPQHS